MKDPRFGRTAKAKLLDHLIAIVLLVSVVAGCKQLQNLASPTVLKSPDGKFQLTVPGGWKENASLNDKANIKAANLIGEMYAIVITEAKADFTEEMTLQEFTNITRETIISNLGDSNATAPHPVTVSGNSGLAYEVDGTIKNVKLAYWVTTIETPEHYHQVITWTLQSRKDKNQLEIQKVIDSFRVTDR